MKKRKKKKTSFFAELMSMIRCIVYAVLIALILNRFVLVNAKVPTGSMENTIMAGDRLFGNRLAYRNEDPQRGDIVIFHYPVGMVLGEDTLYIKRIIGMPGEHVEIRNAKIYIDGSAQPLEEPYLKEEWTVRSSGYTFDVPENAYLMLGDNRNNSGDARVWEEEARSRFAAAGREITDVQAASLVYVQRQEILGKALLRYWPIRNLTKFE
ncbi:MAG: signal peptidase I [Lachnospiraceae bacterium]|nr:signal peptidase I [Lachnospiraceae bacterium]